MRRIAILAVMLLALAGCVPPSNDPLDPSPPPCEAIPHAGGTLCVEILNRHAEILERYVTVTVNAIDQDGASGPVLELACRGKVPRGYPFTCEVLSPYVHGIIAPKGGVIELTVSASYSGAEGDILTCYELDPTGAEVAGSHHTVRTPRTGAPVQVTCGATIIGPTI